jgi:hypothetical protein
MAIENAGHTLAFDEINAVAEDGHGETT